MRSNATASVCVNGTRVRTQNTNGRNGRIRSILLLVLMACAGMNGWAQVYQHSFNNLTSSTAASNPYTTSPTATTPAGVFDANLSSSSWTTSGSFIAAGGNGSTGCLAVSTTSNNMQLTFSVASGYALSVTSFSFWTRTSNSATWTLKINNITVGTGNASGTGASTGTINVSNAVANQTGTITVLFTLGGTGSFRLDDFTLNGTVASTATAPTLTTPTATAISATGATLGANITNYNGSNATQ
ncbi:MAG: hypothetical protein EOO12_05060 [Chitinophagaceae bacterium]|nr:MAG: hypothetical protein EOO12_05060 [Chitinophagaceae bacterium]